VLGSGPGVRGAERGQGAPRGMDCAAFPAPRTRVLVTKRQNQSGLSRIDSGTVQASTSRDGSATKEQSCQTSPDQAVRSRRNSQAQPVRASIRIQQTVRDGRARPQCGAVRWGGQSSRDGSRGRCVAGESRLPCGRLCAKHVLAVKRVACGSEVENALLVGAWCVGVCVCVVCVCVCASVVRCVCCMRVVRVACVL
jgi:hypothetical protein